MALFSQSKTPISRRLAACIQCDECGRFYPPRVYLNHAHIEES